MMIDRRLSWSKRGKRYAKMEVEIRAAEDFLSSFKTSANSAINLKLVTTENDIFDKGKEFHPEFTHQLFGDNETIFGYSGLQVQLYYHSGSLLTYLGMTYDSDVNGKLEGIEAEPVLSTIAEQLPPGFCTNLDDFIAKLPSEGKFRPMGELLYSYRHNEKDYEVYYADIKVPKFKEYHSRLQTFLLWYIDAASFIETDDERWNFYLLFEKKKVSGETEYSIVGYMTVYHYYAYPDKLRPRISQMLVLPPFQKQGHGAKLLNTVEEHYIKDPRVLDITVEDPSDYFIRLRDYVDALACSKLQCFSPDLLKKGFTADLASEAQKARKMNKLQCRRVYEILRLKATDRSNAEEYQNYRLDVKRRLNAPYQKEKADADKLKKVLSAEEMSATLLLPSPSEQRKHLEQLYEELEECYLRTIERIAAS
ncbi:histone acetyltransferase type B catalytic subunit-like [Actinia tenebrosa]|uniref:Histone acetyltransferase type B catalytic subunit n=1 Tax=Actinia tenebrosa TaxID=6105 RepID=A0A6P8HCX0_ACTTE|nr:histone acetyltransferase type B catalytic subunit-like [Actinia tenebrosa]